LIRALTHSDAQAISRLHHQGFLKGWSQTDMEDHIDRDIVLGLGEPVTGFIIIRLVQDQAEILTVLVDQAKRQKGLGRNLLIAGEDAARARGGDIMFLEVAEDNHGAIALYRTAGYEPIGRRPAYYKRDDGRIAALTYRKNLL